MPNHPQATSARRIAGTFAPFHAEAGTAQHRKRHAVFRSRMRVENHRHEHDGVAEQNGEHRLPPRHPLLHQAGRKRVGRDDHAHADPQRGDVIGRPRAPRQRRRREIGVPQRARRHILVSVRRSRATSTARVAANVPGFRSPGIGEWGFGTRICRWLLASRF